MGVRWWVHGCVGSEGRVGGRRSTSCEFARTHDHPITIPLSTNTADPDGTSVQTRCIFHSTIADVSDGAVEPNMLCLCTRQPYSYSTAAHNPDRVSTAAAERIFFLIIRPGDGARFLRTTWWYSGRSLLRLPTWSKAPPAVGCVHSTVAYPQTQDNLLPSSIH